jgi:GNAT superfamily N-acetyltransferase
MGVDAAGVPGAAGGEAAMTLVRAARDDELEEILALDRATLPESVPSADTDWWGAWDGPELVGYAGARLLGNGVYFLSRAGVVESHRGHGLQKRLIRCRVRRARALLAPRAVTYTATHNAPSSNSLIACGFRVYEPEETYAGDDVIYWRKVIT